MRNNQELTEPIQKWKRLIACILLASAPLLVGCAAEHPSSERQVTQPAAPPEEESTATSRQPLRVDLDEIFPPGPGRELVLNNCQNCHAWTPIVVLQMDQEAWYRNSLEHRERVEGLTNEEFKVLYDYLSSTFTPERPVPKLPPELLEAWTTF